MGWSVAFAPVFGLDRVLRFRRWDRSDDENRGLTARAVRAPVSTLSSNQGDCCVKRPFRERSQPHFVLGGGPKTFPNPARGADGLSRRTKIGRLVGFSREVNRANGGGRPVLMARAGRFQSARTSHVGVAAVGPPVRAEPGEGMGLGQRRLPGPLRLLATHSRARNHAFGRPREGGVGDACSPPTAPAPTVVV